MSTTQTSPTVRTATSPWLTMTMIALAVGIVTTIAFAVVATGWTTSEGGAFTYTADIWYTALGLPLAVVGLLHAQGVYRLQPGRTGRRGAVGLWINTICCVGLFVMMLGSLVARSELRWGLAYPLFALGTVIGLGLLAAGSWSVGLFPRWLLGIWPIVWIAGSFAAQGATPLLLAAYYLVFALILARHALPAATE